MLLKSRFIDINGYKLHILEGGKGRPLLIIPGWFGTAEIYNHAGEVLSQKYRVIIADPPGFGQSGKLHRHWNFDDYGKVFNGLIKLEKLNNLILIGHSLGGAIALSIYQENNSITQLIVADCLGLKTPNLFKSWAQNTVIKSAHREALVYLPEFLRKFFSPFFVSLKRSIKIIYNLDLTEELKKINKKTVILWGEKDNLLSVEFGRSLSGKIKSAEFVVVEQANHSWTATDQERFINYIHYYVKGD